MIQREIFVQSPLKQRILTVGNNGFAFGKKFAKFFERFETRRVLFCEQVEFRCSFRVGIVVLLVVRLGQRPQVGRTTLLSARVRAY